MDVGAIDIVGWVGALGIGSTVGQYLSGGRQRREVRSEALRALAACESGRWYEGSSSDASFPELMRSLESAALIARTPRPAVRLYLVCANAAYGESRETAEINPGPDGEGHISSQTAQVVRRSAVLLTNLCWRPILARRTLVREVKAIEAEIAAVDDQRSRRHFNRAVELSA